MHPLVKSLFNLQSSVIEPVNVHLAPFAFIGIAKAISGDGSEKGNIMEARNIYDPRALPNNAINFKLKHWFEISAQPKSREN